MRIWLTGGSGSGKSTVAEMLAKQGFTVVDADRIAHSLTDKDGAAYDAVVSAFGAEILRTDGTIDRRALGAIVYNDAEKMACLNSIMHTYIIAAMEAQTGGEGRFVIDAALPNTFGLHCDATIAVIAPRDVRIARLTARDDITPAYAAARLDAQAADEVYTGGAEYVLVNDGDLSALHTQLQTVLKDLKQ